MALLEKNIRDFVEGAEASIAEVEQGPISRMEMTMSMQFRDDDDETIDAHFRKFRS